VLYENWFKMFEVGKYFIENIQKALALPVSTQYSELFLTSQIDRKQKKKKKKKPLGLFWF